MKYQIIGIEHAVGDFIPTNGKNAGQSQHYDLYRLHTQKKNAAIIGGYEAVVVRANPDQMGQIVAECGGTLDGVVNKVYDFDTRNSYGKINLTAWELLK